MKRTTSLCLAVALTLAGSLSANAAEAKKNAKAKAAPAPAPAEKADAPASNLPETVAVVEGAEIKREELEKAFNTVLDAQGIPAETLPEQQRAQGYRMILEDMVVEKLVAKRAEKTQVTDEQVAAMFERIKGNFGSEEELNAQIAKHGQTVEKLKKDIRSSIQQQTWLDEQLKGKTAVTDADAEAFYKKNTEQFQKPEQVRASHILIRVDQDAKPEVVKEKEEKAKAIAVRVKKKGEDFNKVAQEVSEDPSAKQNSGDLDFFAKEQMVPEFSNAAFAMKKDEISEPVRSQFGFHVIKVTDRKAPETVSLDQAKPQLMAFLQQQKKQQEMQKLIGEIRKAADVKINLPAAPAPAPAASVGAPSAALEQ